MLLAINHKLVQHWLILTKIWHVRQAQANLEKDIASQKYADVEVKRYLTLCKKGRFLMNNQIK